MAGIADREASAVGQVGRDDGGRETLQLGHLAELAVERLDQPGLILGVDVLPHQVAEHGREAGDLGAWPETSAITSRVIRPPPQSDT